MNKIKSFLESEKGKDILIVIIVILVGLGSFELGRLSNGGKSGGIKIEYPREAEKQENGAILGAEYNAQAASAVSTGKNFFASTRGTKYYPAGCSAGASLKEENKVWFDTREEAEAAGYELSGSCR